LSKINQALLLLAKIENQQFPEVTEINLCELVKQRLEFLEELIDFKKIKIILNLEHPFIVKMNAYLAEILVNNLLSNAIKHNIENGQILLISFPEKLIISNTGKPLTIVPEKLFQRFVKHNSGNDSTGLGLAIASEICIRSNLVLQYSYENGYHKLKISH
jgi:signal transduction histidine kinase